MEKAADPKESSSIRDLRAGTHTFPIAAHSRTRKHLWRNRPHVLCAAASSTVEETNKQKKTSFAEAQSKRDDDSVQISRAAKLCPPSP